MVDAYPATMRVHVESIGSGPPVVCTHGIGASRHTFDALTDELKDQFTVITWDLPGHGQSQNFEDAAAYDRDRVLEDLDEIVADLTQPPIMLGHSLGGYLTLAWAATRSASVAGYVIMATGPGFRNAEKRDSWNAMSRRNAHRFGVATPVTEMNLQHDSVVMERMDQMTSRFELLVGDEDNPQLQGGMSYLAAKLPDADLTVVPEGDHLMHEAIGAVATANAVRRISDRYV